MITAPPSPSCLTLAADWVGHPLVVAAVFSAAGSALAALAIASLIRQDRAMYGATSRHLARRLGVSAAQRRLLGRVARDAGLPSPVAILVSRGCFDHAAALFVRHHGGAERLAQIRSRVFGGSPES